WAENLERFERMNPTPNEIRRFAGDSELSLAYRAFAEERIREAGTALEILALVDPGGYYDNIPGELVTAFKLQQLEVFLSRNPTPEVFGWYAYNSHRVDVELISRMVKSALARELFDSPENVRDAILAAAQNPHAKQEAAAVLRDLVRPRRSCEGLF
ncbi:MAG: hypothetical protein AAB250_12510, partial [Bdellovibrionota bacterium]